MSKHHLGKPAEFDHKIITRRVDLVKNIEGFCRKDLELVDVGCGNGASLFKLSDEMKSCTGIEIFDGHKEAFENYKKQNQKENCEFVLIDIENEKFERQFDRLISFEVIEHLTDDKSVSEFYKFLKKGGLAAITVPNKWWIFETHGANLPLLPWNRVPLFSWLPTPIHEKYSRARIYTKNRIKNLLESVGFEILQMEYVTAPLDVLKEGSLKTFFTENIFNTDTTEVPFMATSIFILARKN
ncbi:MAG: class I SAM-dependent methyltransferase [Calditrichaeota bacterium]|nr:MAG: class I SAM-dependent methyltransferase [Calditrichota bacterium]